MTGDPRLDAALADIYAKLPVDLTQDMAQVAYEVISTEIQQVLVDVATTDDLPEGASNLYFTDARAAAAVHLAVTDEYIGPEAGVYFLLPVKETSGDPTF